MNNQQTENPESQIAAIKKPLLPKGCLILLVAAIAVCVLPIAINTLNVFYHQVRWHFAQIASYSFELGYFGLDAIPVQNIIVEDGKLVQPRISFTREGETVTERGAGFLNLTVNDLFLRAYSCFIYTFCQVKFDDRYGYPVKIGGGFLERSWITARNLEPIKTEG